MNEDNVSDLENSMQV